MSLVFDGPLLGASDAPAGADPAALLTIAERLVRTAGELVLAGRSAGLAEVGTKSTVTDMVTEYDRAAERLIADGIRSARPGDAIIGEEGTADAGSRSSPIRWYVDPIDGTTNYLYGLPGYGISIAAADAHGVLVGAVAVPRLGEVFTAIRGRGAWLGGEPISVRQGATLNTALVATGFGYAPAQRRAQAAMWARVIGEIRDLRRLGAAAVDLCYVACGRFDAYAEHGLSPWDVAAGALIATEAGAQLGAVEGGALRPASALAASPALFGPLQALLAGAGSGTIAAIVDGHPST